MAINTGLMIKSGVAVVGTGLAATGIYTLSNYFANILSKYEYEFIDFLHNKENDIIFDVKKEDGNSDLSDKDISFGSGNTQKVSFSAKVQLKGNSGSSFKVNGKDATDDKISTMKGWSGGNWTWECALEFQKNKSADKNEIKDEYKNLIFKGSNEGLLGILKTDVHTYDDTNKDLKNRTLKK